MSNSTHAGRRAIDHAEEPIPTGRRAEDTVNTWFTLGNNVWKFVAGFIVAIAWLVTLYFGLKSDISETRASADRTYATQTQLAQAIQDQHDATKAANDKLDQLLILVTRNSARLDAIDKALSK